MSRRHALALLACLTHVACGGSSSDATSGGGGSTTTATTATATSGSGGDGATSTTSGGDLTCPIGELCLEPPASGFQVTTVGDAIQPGEDVEYCEVVALPGGPDDTYFVEGFELAMTSFSHHLIVAAAMPDSATEQAITPGMKQKCYGADVFGGDITGVTGSQKPHHEEQFPPGVGKRFKGGQKLIFDYHYFNSSSSPVKARAAVNFKTVDASMVTREAHAFGFYNLGFSVPPNSTKSFSGECRFKHDVMVSKLTRHTHQWGKDFSVAYAGGAKDGEHIWTTPNYEDTDHLFAEPVLMKAGEGFRFSCEFANTTAKTLKFGLTASDEMCILFGTWFTPMIGAPEEDQDCITD
ncbi:MAG: hypothetical protein FJ095_02550 [Deltaproteobacteria bacterium]|nr:hypothetical protein [Deltaproteobacteria bacterium]